MIYLLLFFNYKNYSVLFFRRPYPGTNHPEWLPNLEGPISIYENIFAFTHIYNFSSVLIWALKPILVLYTQTLTQRNFFHWKAFIASLLELLITMKSHNTISSFKNQLQRETLASESLISIGVITLQPTQITHQNKHIQLWICRSYTFLLN